MNEQNEKWHQFTVNTVEEKLNTNASSGLSRKEARSRYRKYGANTIFDATKTTKNSGIKDFLADPALILLFFVGILSLCFSEIRIGLSTLICLAVGICFSLYLFYTERKFQNEIEKYRIPEVDILREGKKYRISAREIVPGDVLLLRKGDIVPADCRLIWENDVRVLTLCPDKTGKPMMVELPKNADRIYPYKDRTFAPFYENILYGGSEILDGSARAIVLETGENTFLGAMKAFQIPTELGAGKRVASAHGIRPYLRFYGFAVFILLLPLAVVGMLTAPENTGIFSVFLSLCALAVTGSQAFLLSFFRVPDMRVQKKRMLDDDYENRLIFKSTRAMGRLATITDLFVLGHYGSSDGKLHLYRVATGKGELDLEANDSKIPLQPLCEAFILLHQAHKALPDHNADISDFFGALRRELLAASGTDIEALEMRLLRVSFAENEDTMLDVTLKNETYQLLFSVNAAFVSRCTFYEEDGRILVLDGNVRKALYGFIDSVVEQGCGIQIVVKRAAGRMILLGIVAFREQMQAILPSVLEELKQSGVQISFFLRGETATELRYANAARLPQKVFDVTENQDRIDLSDLVDRYRVFTGFSDRDLFRAIQALKKNGHCVAVLGGETEDLSLMRAASLSIACDPMPYPKTTSQDISSEKFPIEEDKGGIQMLRRHADILIHRAGRLGGGLSAFLGGISDCRTTDVHQKMILRYLTVSQISRLIVTVLSVILGLGSLTGAQLLFLGLIGDAVCTMWISTLFIPQNRLRKAAPMHEKGVERILSDRKLWMPPLLSAGITCIYIWVLRFCEVITSTMCIPFLFWSLLLLQVVTLLLISMQAKAIFSFRDVMLPIAILLLPILILTAFSVAFPVFHSIFLLGEWNLVTLLSLPLSPVLYLLFRHLISAFFGRTAK